MTAPDRILASRHVVRPEGTVPGAVVIRQGRIDRIVALDHPLARGAEDLGETWLLPGLVDTHVHLNAPGRTEWEGFESGTRAAAAGGITTLVDMPLNAVPPTTSIEGLHAKRAEAEGRCHVDVGFWGGVVPGNRHAIESLADEGVLGFKCFMSASGVPEFEAATDQDIAAIASLLAARDLPLLVHAEDEPTLAQARKRASGDPRLYATWLACRPPEAEAAACRRLAAIVEQRPFRLHVVHAACEEAVDWIVPLRSRGIPVSVETCPHYLHFAAEDIVEGATAWKCAPPIREAAVRERLWAALGDGRIALIASDHSPCPPEMKRMASGDFLAAWGGIASLEWSLAAVWTEAKQRGFSLDEVCRWMAEAPARLAGLSGRKGVIAPGADADLVAFDPHALHTVDTARRQQRHPVTPYAGRTLLGRVRRTWLRGTAVWDGERVARGYGRCVTRTSTSSPDSIVALPPDSERGA